MKFEGKADERREIRALQGVEAALDAVDLSSMALVPYRPMVFSPAPKVAAKSFDPGLRAETNF